MEDLTAFQRDMLYVVAGLDDLHGLAIKDELEEYYDNEVHHGRLYPNLDALANKGLVSKGGMTDGRTAIRSPSKASASSTSAASGKISTSPSSSRLEKCSA
jgi:PadR family transcriptional regulator, regulatory protein PadR